MMYAPISNAVYPHVVRLAASDKDALFSFNRKLLAVFCVVAAPACLITFALSPFVIEILFGKAFVPAAPVLQIFSLLPFLMVLSNIFGIQTMLPLGMQSQFGKILAAAAFVDIILFIPAVRYFGAEGAAFVNVFVELFVTGAMAIVLHQTGNSLFANTFKDYKLKGSLRDL
jgi:PST family polysaccharide transporter